MKGVVLAGGQGTRLLPFTRVVNKHLLPVYDRPMICYPIDALVQAGIEDVMIVGGGEHAGGLQTVLGDGKALGLRRLHYAYQTAAGGIADALRYAEEFVGRDRFVLILGDNIFEKALRPAVDRFQRQDRGAKIFLKRVADPHRFGVAQMVDGRVTSIEEKPQKPKSDLAVTGVYCYDDQVFDIIHMLEPSARGELEITDVNNAYIKRGMLSYEFLEGWWVDVGTLESRCEAERLVAQDAVANSVKGVVR